MKPIVWMFSGQGSHYYQMGSELFEAEPIFRQTIERGDNLFQQLTNLSLSKEIYSPRQNRFDPFKRTLYTHPAIFLVEYALVELLKSKGAKPDYLLGYSVGEFTAFVASGALTFEDAFSALVKQAELLEYCATNKSLFAILDHTSVTEKFPSEFRDCTIVCRNFERGFILSAPENRAVELTKFLKANSINSMELPISHGFHSEAIDPISTPFRAILNKLTLANFQTPVLSALTGPVETPSTDHLWQAARQPIDFPTTFQKIEANGPFTYIDLGPSGTMATLIKHNLSKTSQSDYLPIITPFGRAPENLNRALTRHETRT